MKVEINGIEYKILFRHTTEEGKPKMVPSDPGHTFKPTKVIVTTCTICSVRPNGIDEEGKPAYTYDELSKGESICHPNDNWSKLVGRYISYCRALTQLEADESFKRKMNREFFKVNKPTKIRQQLEDVGMAFYNPREFPIKLH